MVHWKLVLKRIFRRICYVLCIRELLTWPYESCERCGHCFRLCWSVKDNKWIEVMGHEEGCLCIDCFIELAYKKGIFIQKSDIERIEVFNPEE